MVEMLLLKFNNPYNIYFEILSVINNAIVKNPPQINQFNNERRGSLNLHITYRMIR